MKVSKETEKILHGLEKAYEKMVKFKKYKNTPLIVQKDGKIVTIQANDIPSTTKYFGAE